MTNLERVLVLVDADNTLWDTDAVYAAAQERLLERVGELMRIALPKRERLALVRDVDQEIAAIHHARLRYPGSLLARGLSLRFQGVGSAEVARIVCRSRDKSEIAENDAEELGSEFHADLQKRATLRTGVLEGMTEIGALGLRPMVVTEGHKKRCEELLRFYQLEKFFQSLLEAPKQIALYARLFKLHGGYDRRFMIGDQLDRDISPAKQAGYVTIYFPSGFVPKWSPDKEAMQPDYEICSFIKVPEIIRSECVAPGRRPSP
jgi:putative hydrolase of the HAD superfamily